MNVLKVAAVYLALAAGANAQALSGAPLEGDMRKLNPVAPSTSAPEIEITDAQGAAHTLAEWRGKHLLVNFWATWCAPCRKEMPSLSALQQELGGEAFEVLTVATGRETVEGVERFFDEVGVSNLPVLIDDGSLARAMSVFGLPITVILDPEGREIARLRGDADWNAPEARAVISALTAEDG